MIRLLIDVPEGDVGLGFLARWIDERSEVQLCIDDDDASASVLEGRVMGAIQVAGPDGR